MNPLQLNSMLKTLIYPAALTIIPVTANTLILGSKLKDLKAEIKDMKDDIRLIKDDIRELRYKQREQRRDLKETDGRLKVVEGNVEQQWKRKALPGRTS